jgi:hypothetical protein
MFKRGWLLHSDRIYSDEGFFVVPGKDCLVYNEAGRKMTMTVEMGKNGFAIYEETVGRWDDNPAISVSNDERKRVGDNVRRALESQGQTVIFI